MPTSGDAVTDGAGVTDASRDASKDVADSSGPTDTEDESSQPPNLWWSSIENTCRTAGPPPPERHGEPLGPAHDVTQPTLAWRVTAPCPHLGTASSTSAYAMARLEVDGVEKEVVVMSHELPNYDATFGALAAVAVLDAETGETLSCHEVPTELQGLGPYPMLVADSGSGRFYLFAYTAEGDGHMPPGFPYGRSSFLFTGSLGVPGPLEYFHYPQAGANRGEIIATRQGQLVVQLGGRLAAIHPQSGEVIWTRGPDELDVELPFFGGMGPRRDGGAWVAGTLTTGQELLWHVDDCGVASTVMSSRSAIATPLELDDATMLVTLGVHRELPFRVVQMRNGEEVWVQNGCVVPALLDGARYACLTYSGFHPDGKVLAGPLGGGPATVVDLSAEVGSGTLQDWLVAAEGSLVVVGVAFSTPRLTRLLFVDFEAGRVTATFDVPAPDYPTLSSDNHPSPLLTSRGTLVQAYEGRIVGIHTSLRGLAKTPYPYSRRWGNEGRGAIEP